MITADVYGAGGRRPAARPGARRASTATPAASSARSGTTSSPASATGRAAIPRFTDPALRGPAEYADYLRAATEASLERVGISTFDLLLLHNPDRTGFTSEAVWDGMAALVDAGLAARSGSRPGPRTASPST